MRAEGEGNPLETLIIEISDSDFRNLINRELFLCYRSKEKIKRRGKFLDLMKKHASAEVFLEPREDYIAEGRCAYCYKPLEIEGKIEGRVVDFRVAIDMVYFAGKDSYDISMLLSGDRHYVIPVNHVKNLGKKIVIAAFESDISPELKSVATEFLSFDSIKAEIEFKR